MKKHVTAKLKALALTAGIPSLPGPGTLTLATRKVHGGRDQVIQYLRMAAADGDLHARTFLHVWDTLKAWEQKLATLDDVCAAAGVAPVKLVKAIVGTAYEANCDVANFVAAHSHPDVIQQSVDVALTPDGVEDRKMLMQHAGFLPAAKGSVINIGVSASASAHASATSDSDGAVPDFLDDMEELIEVKGQVQQKLIAESLPPALDLAAIPEAELAD